MRMSKSSPPKKRIAVGRFDLEQAVVNLKNCHVKRTAAQIEYSNGFGFFFVQTIRQAPPQSAR